MDTRRLMEACSNKSSHQVKQAILGYMWLAAKDSSKKQIPISRLQISYNSRRRGSL